MFHINKKLSIRSYSFDKSKVIEMNTNKMFSHVIIAVKNFPERVIQKDMPIHRKIPIESLSCETCNEPFF